MHAPIGGNMFEVGKSYYDAEGDPWRVEQIFHVNGWPCLLVCYAAEYCPGIVEDDGKHALVMFPGGGTTTIYADKEYI